MKKIFFTLIMIIAGCQLSLAQYTKANNTADKLVVTATSLQHANGIYPFEDNDSVVVKDAAYYKSKSRNAMIGSICMAGVGAVCLAIGIKNLADTDLFDDNSDGGIILTGIGSGLLLGSIPFTVMSGVYKRKARAIMKTQSTGFGIPSGNKSITGISISIPIGR